jgi:hypothetical protein
MLGMRGKGGRTQFFYTWDVWVVTAKISFTLSRVRTPTFAGLLVKHLTGERPIDHDESQADGE